MAMGPSETPHPKDVASTREEAATTPEVISKAPEETSSTQGHDDSSPSEGAPEALDRPREEEVWAMKAKVTFDDADKSAGSYITVEFVLEWRH